jgi:Zn finger protein HypA/HybF involved in hydrogenase expression
MSLETKLTITAECEDCPAKESESHYGGEQGVNAEEGLSILDFMFELEHFKGWELEPVAYAEHKFYCPQCKQKREALAA